MHRRQFLKRLNLAIGSAALTNAADQLLSLSPQPIAAPGGAKANASGQLLRTIPSSGERIPAVGMGTYITFNARPGDADRRRALREVLRIFHSAGGRLVDSSPMYGAAEAVFGELSSELKINADCFIATKVWTRGGANGQAQMDASVRKLGRKQQLELMQIHNLVDWRTHVPTLRRWQAAGRARYLGVTHYTPAAFGELERVLKQERFDFVQLPYSVATRTAEQRLLPLCADRGVGVIVNRPYEGGDLFRSVRGQPLPGFARELGCTSFGQLFLKFLLAHPAVTSVIPATSKARHMRDNMGAGLGPLPDAKLRERIAALL